jgi:hypothetical protein
MSSSCQDRRTIMEATNLAEIYGTPLLDWSGIAARLEAGVSQAPDTGGPNRHTWWLATVNHDGSPHVNGVGALWVDGSVWFETGERTRKGLNLARDPRCSLSVATHDYDLVVEGRAQIVDDPTTVAQMAARWVEQGWPVRVDETGRSLTAEYSAPSAGRPPWLVYRLTALSVTAIATTGVGGATRWTFSNDS